MYIELKVEPSDTISRVTNKAILIAQTLCLDVKFTIEGKEVHVSSRDSVRQAMAKIHGK